MTAHSSSISTMTRNCPLCDATDKTPLYVQRFNNTVVSPVSSYTVSICSDCGFAYADGIPDQRAFNAYYAALSKYEFNAHDGIASGDHLAYFEKVFAFLAPHLPSKDARILDIGCSTGALLNVFKKNGYSNLLGIDPSDSCASAAKALFGIEVVSTNIDGFAAEEPFDLVILSATIEHLVDVQSSMRRIREMLADGGLVFIEAPDAERFVDFISAPFQQFSVEHINYFSRHSARNLLSASGYEVVDLAQGANTIALTTDPDIMVLGRRTTAPMRQCDRDTITEPKLRAYIADCERIDAQLRNLIRERVGAAPQIIVWGVGTHTQRLIGTGLDLSQIAYFVDSNARYIGKQLHGKAIKAPSEVQGELPILVSTFSYQKEIVAQITEDLKLRNPVITLY